MKASIIKIGNSHGVRIPKPILEQCGFQSEVELEVVNQALIIKSSKETRKNWSSAFKKMSENSDDLLLDGSSTEWETEEWEWK